MKPIEIFSEFISKELDGDIQKVLDYNLNDKEMLSRFPAPPFHFCIFMQKRDPFYMALP